MTEAFGMARMDSQPHTVLPEGLCTPLDGVEISITVPHDLHGKTPLRRETLNRYAMWQKDCGSPAFAFPVTIGAELVREARLGR